MKKIFLFPIFLLILFSQTYAQTELRIGAKGGVNFSNIAGDFTEKFTNQTGFHIGGTLEIPLIDKLSLQPEILYSTQGAKNNETAVDGPLTETKLDYLNIPLLGKYYLTEGLSVMAGPQVGLLLAAENEITPSGFMEGPTQPYKEDVKKYFNTVDAGIVLGAEYRFPFGAFLQLRYVIGISNVNKSSTDRVLGSFYFENTKNQNRVFQISCGYSF